MLNSYDFIPDSQVPKKKGVHRSLHLPLETGAAASSPNSARSGSREVGDQWRLSFGSEGIRSFEELLESMQAFSGGVNFNACFFIIILHNLVFFSSGTMVVSNGLKPTCSVFFWGMINTPYVENV